MRPTSCWLPILPMRTRGIEAFVDQVHRAIGELDVEAHLRMAGDEFGDRRGEMPCAKVVPQVSRSVPRGRAVPALADSSASSRSASS